MSFNGNNPRFKLTADEAHLLDDVVLPTARRWLHIHGLAAHGAKTLAYWGEEFEIPKETAAEIKS